MHNKKFHSDGVRNGRAPDTIGFLRVTHKFSTLHIFLLNMLPGPWAFVKVGIIINGLFGGLKLQRTPETISFFRKNYLIFMNSFQIFNYQRSSHVASQGQNFS